MLNVSYIFFAIFLCLLRENGPWWIGSDVRLLFLTLCGECVSEFFLYNKACCPDPVSTSRETVRIILHDPGLREHVMKENETNHLPVYEQRASHNFPGYKHHTERERFTVVLEMGLSFGLLYRRLPEYELLR